MLNINHLNARLYILYILNQQYDVHINTNIYYTCESLYYMQACIYQVVSILEIFELYICLVITPNTSICVFTPLNLNTQK